MNLLKEEREAIIKDPTLTDKDKKTIIMGDFIGDYFETMLKSPLVQTMIMGYYAFNEGYFDDIIKEIKEKNEST